ncbi:MAG: hypothetical protein Q8P18_01125 [Pseudomonadota bacterium]|nr:hypothetical protein [Pseudomonadota bacterium]
MSDPALPPLYARWMDALLGGHIPKETRATCSNCAMAPPAGEPMGPGQFDPTTKCCTYVPRLPNFLVGAVLADEDPDNAPGRATVEGRILAGVGVTPLGLARPPAWDLLYRHGVVRSDTAFGRTRSLRCPHFLADGRCGIWRHREGVCATWHCRNDRGAVGLAFWEALGGLLGVLERSLSYDAVLALGLEGPALRHLLDAPQPADGPALDGRQSPAARRAIWGGWAERERELYVATAARVERMNWSEVRRIAGPEGEAHAQLVLQAWQALVWAETPARLQLARLGSVEIGAETTAIVTHRGYDPIEVPSKLLPFLARFDGRPVELVRAELDAEGATVDGAVVQRLVDWGVLVKA